MRLSLLPVLILTWPLAEIAGFVVVGRALGLWATLALVIGSALMGGLLLRLQGTHLLRQLSEAGRRGQVPGRALVDGAMMVVAAILLLLPGFISDIIGLLLFIPPVRQAIWSLVGRRFVVVQTGPDPAASSGRPIPGAPPSPSTGPVIDLDQDDYRRNSSSPWTRRNGPKD
jgi:UPF0716 protein FxsA